MRGGWFVICLVAGCGSTPQRSTPHLELSDPFQALLCAGPAEYAAGRASFLRLPGAREFLESETQHASTAEARAIAEALLIRFEEPAHVAAIDGFHCAPLNPGRPVPHVDTRCREDHVAVYRPYPALAFELLDKTDQNECCKRDLVDVVTASNRDAFERVEWLLGRYNGAASAMVRIDRVRAVAPLLGFLATASPDRAEAAGSLGATGTKNTAVRDRLRSLFRSGDSAEREAAAYALVSLGDLAFADDLWSLLLEPREYQFAHSGTVEKLGRLLGPATLGEELEQRSHSESAAERTRAAIGLGLETRYAPSRITALLALGHDTDVVVQATALLATDSMLNDSSPALRTRLAELRSMALAGARSPIVPVRRAAVQLLNKLANDDNSILSELRRLGRAEPDRRTRAQIASSLDAWLIKQ
jgi:hypothetical protein